jgi:hypothetical protein
MIRFVVLCLFALFVYGEIVECPKMQLLQEHVSPEALVIFDIDDTLLVPEHMLGSDEWFSSRLNEQKSLGNLDAFPRTLSEWQAIRHLSKMEVVEPGTDAIIQALQHKKQLVMGLTTQEISLSVITPLQLQENAIDLSVTAPSVKEHYFQIQEKGVLYRKGILFTAGTHKGEALFALLDELKYTPKKIVFINDKASHLQEIEVSSQKRNIPFIGLRYGYCDARKKAFDPKIAAVQFAGFAKILSDEEALLRLKTSMQDKKQQDPR